MPLEVLQTPRSTIHRVAGMNGTSWRCAVHSLSSLSAAALPGAGVEWVVSRLVLYIFYPGIGTVENSNGREL